MIIHGVAVLARQLSLPGEPDNVYLAIDQHAKQITVCVRNEEGDTVLRRQVSTRPEKIQAFFQQLTEMDIQFMAILEVCGFNDWLIEYLRKWSFQEIVLIHPEKPGKRKTDRRDAQKLADLLWLNRERLAIPITPECKLTPALEPVRSIRTSFACLIAILLVASGCSDGKNGIEDTRELQDGVFYLYPEFAFVAVVDESGSTMPQSTLVDAITCNAKLICHATRKGAFYCKLRRKPEDLG
ncbi:IS110 family transposase [Novipirellula artificiosorum]|uniref:IS110 family transposase n=1 Tax=Novipirellula artificiosorum TaxID=2528016 RepID=UPI0018CFE56B|nr:transposase [Novipirellula artificiosorum]